MRSVFINGSPFWLLAVACMTSGCSPEAFLAGAAKTPQAQYASEVVRLLRERRYEDVLARMAEDVRSEVSPETFEEVASYFPSAEPLSETLVGYHRFFGAQPRAVVTFEYAFDTAYALAEVVVLGQSDAYSVGGLHVWPLERSLREIHAFELADKTGRHYLILVLMVVIPIICLYALVRCLGTQNLKRRWLWIVFIVLGIGQASLNWTTGELNFNPLSFSLFGITAFTASAYAPWIVSVSLPLGAMLFLAMRNRLGRRVEAEDA